MKAVVFSLWLTAGSAMAQCVPPTVLTETDYDAVQARDNRCLRQTVKIPIDYFTLALSWSPAFCRSARSRGDLSPRLAFQCEREQPMGWIVHGLWGQSAKPDTCTLENGRTSPVHPRWCQGDLPPVATSDMLPFMCMQPGAALMQGEWEKHGACSHATPRAYFEQEQKLFSALKLPTTEMAPDALLTWVKNANPQHQGKTIRLNRDGSELYVCYTSDYAPMDCPAF